MLGTVGIRKSHPPRTSCTALLTSRADDEAFKAGSQPLSIRTSTLKSNYCTTLSKSWKRPRKVDNTLKDKSAVLGRKLDKRHRLQSTYGMLLSEYGNYMRIGLLGCWNFLPRNTDAKILPPVGLIVWQPFGNIVLH